MKKIMMIIIVVMTITVGSIWLWQHYMLKTGSSTQNVQTATTTSDVEMTVAETDVKVYRNEEWGFQFMYPSDWRVSENSFHGYYTKFSAVLFPIEGKYWDYPVLIHIVPPEFVEKSFKNIDKDTSNIVVGGVKGIKYAYSWEGREKSSIILPLGESRMILAADPHYPELFDQVLQSFEFLY